MKKIIVSLAIITLFSCSNDDSTIVETNPEVTPTLAELQAITTQLLTNNNEKGWRISQAELRNNQNTIDISTNFNVVDDEFLFTASTLEWRKGNEINYQAMTSQQAKLDYYVAPETYSYDFSSGSDTQLSVNSAISLTVQENGSIAGIIQAENDVEMHITLVAKNAQDYLTPESAPLQFTEEFTINMSLEHFGTGMIGSESDNSFYIAHRGFYNNAQAQRIIKKDLTSGVETEQIINNNHFAYKKMHLINNQLAVVNSQAVEIYDLGFSGTPMSYPTASQLPSGTGLSVVYGTATQGDDVYVIGGNFGGNPATIYKFNLATQTYTTFATLPAGRYGADATIVNNTLYIFGGATSFPSVQPAQNTIYSIPLNNPSAIQTFQMNNSINVSYVKVRQNLIYIAGIKFVGNTVNGITQRESIIGVFNTVNNTYEELQHNLNNTSGIKGIEEMCLVGNKMYIIYGDMLGEGLQDWSIYSATIN